MATAATAAVIGTSAAAACTVIMTVTAAAAAAAAALIGDEGELTVHHKLCCVVCIAAEACECNDTVIGKSLSCAGADVSDDDDIDTVFVHEVCNCLVAGLLDLNDLFAGDLGLVVVGSVDCKVLGWPKCSYISPSL